VSGNTGFLHEIPSDDGNTTVATLVALNKPAASVVAADELLGGELDADLSAGLDAQAIAKSFSGTEGPATSTLLLVQDVVHRLAVGVITPVIIGRKVGSHVALEVILTQGRGLSSVASTGSHKSLDLINGHVAELIVTSSPASTGRVDLIDDILSHSELLCRHSGD